MLELTKVSATSHQQERKQAVARQTVPYTAVILERGEMPSCPADDDGVGNQKDKGKSQEKGREVAVQQQQRFNGIV